MLNDVKNSVSDYLYERGRLFPKMLAVDSHLWNRLLRNERFKSIALEAKNNKKQIPALACIVEGAMVIQKESEHTNESLTKPTRRIRKKTLEYRKELFEFIDMCNLFTYFEYHISNQPVQDFNQSEICDIYNLYYGKKVTYNSFRQMLVRYCMTPSRFQADLHTFNKEIARILGFTIPDSFATCYVKNGYTPEEGARRILLLSSRKQQDKETKISQKIISRCLKDIHKIDWGKLSSIIWDYKYSTKAAATHQNEATAA